LENQQKLTQKQLSWSKNSHLLISYGRKSLILQMEPSQC